MVPWHLLEPPARPPHPAPGRLSPDRYHLRRRDDAHAAVDNGMPLRCQVMQKRYSREVSRVDFVQDWAREQQKFMRQTNEASTPPIRSGSSPSPSSPVAKVAVPDTASLDTLSLARQSSCASLRSPSPDIQWDVGLRKDWATRKNGEEELPSACTADATVAQTREADPTVALQPLNAASEPPTAAPEKPGSMHLASGIALAFCLVQICSPFALVAAEGADTLPHPPPFPAPRVRISNVLHEPRITSSHAKVSMPRAQSQGAAWISMGIWFSRGTQFTLVLSPNSGRHVGHRTSSSESTPTLAVAINHSGVEAEASQHLVDCRMAFILVQTSMAERAVPSCGKVVWAIQWCLRTGPCTALYSY